MSKTSRQKQRIWLIIAFLIIGYAASKYAPNQPIEFTNSSSNIEHVIQQHQSDVQLEVSGEVKDFWSKLLQDIPC
jgi:hypothetical protein